MSGLRFPSPTELMEQELLDPNCHFCAGWRNAGASWPRPCRVHHPRQLRAEVDRLREALRPFTAEWIDDYADSAENVGADLISPALPVEAFRAARKALDGDASCPSAAITTEENTHEG